MNQRERVCYNTDASRLIGKTERVISPKNTEEVLQIIKSANQDIVPRGAGTGLSGGAIPDNSIVVDMGKMNLVSNFNPSKRSVNVQAGVTIKELNEKLNAVGFEFPIYPSNGGVSSIGGMIATNASGNRSMKYIHMKDWIEELEFVNGKAELIKASKADLSEACGLEGITGIITSATLKLIPIIKRSISIFQSQSLDEVLSVARQLKQEKETCMLAFFSKSVSRMLGFSEAYHLIIEFDSDRGRISGEEYEKLSKIKEKAYEVLFREGYYDSEDPKFFFDKIKEFCLILEEKNIPYFGDLGEGVILPFFKDTEKQKKAEMTDLIKKMRVKLGKYGFGLTRKSLLDSFDSRLIQRVKIRHDPDEKFNKNKLTEVEASLKKSIIDTYKDRSREVETERERKIEGEIEEEKDIEIEERKRRIRKLKTPDEDLQDFIKEAEELERTELKREPLREIKKEIEKEVEIIKKENEEKEIKDMLLDYEQIFESELPEERRKNIENFAKNIPRTIEKEQVFTPRRTTSEEEKDMINKILGNRFKAKEKKEENNSDKTGGNN